MAKKKKQESPEDQMKRFEAEVRRLIDAGKLNPTEAEERLDRVIRHVSGRDTQSSD
jgi:hypothetical protein